MGIQRTFNSARGCRVHNRRKYNEIIIETGGGRHQIAIVILESYQVVSAFTYPRCYQASKNDKMEAVTCRMSAANSAQSSLLPLRKAQDLTCRSRVTIYKAVMRQFFLYGSETSSLLQSAEKGIDLFREIPSLSIWANKISSFGM
jgi:hypothetical protein